MSVDAIRRRAREQTRDRRSYARIGTGRRDAEAHSVALADWIDGQVAAAWDRLGADHQHVEKELDPILGQECRWEIPRELSLVVFEEVARNLLRVGEINLGAGRAGGTKGD